MNPETKPNIRIIWHGGEPLLAGLAFYEKVIELEKEVGQQYGLTFHNSVQTNGVLINADWARFFAQHKWGVGVSFDGLPHLHDLHRKSKGGKGTAEKVIQSIKLLQQWGVKPAVIVVVTNAHIPYAEDIYRFLTKELSVRRFAVSPQTDLRTRKPGIDIKGYARFMSELFDVWVEDDNPDVEIRELKEWAKSLLGGQSSVCTINANLCGRFPAVNNNLMLTYCDSYDNVPEFELGSIEISDIKFLLNKRDKIAARIYKDREQCLKEDCKYINVCFGGCPRHWAEGKNYFCEAYKEIFSHIESWINAHLVALES